MVYLEENPTQRPICSGWLTSLYDSFYFCGYSFFLLMLGLFVCRLECYGKIPASTIPITIHHGFTLGFRSETSKSCSVAMCSTFSWWPSSRSVGLERDWCALGVFLLNCTGFGTVTNEFCHASCLWSWGKGGGKLQMEESLWGLHCICYASIYSVISLSLWNAFTGSGHTHPLWIVAFSVSG